MKLKLSLCTAFDKPGDRKVEAEISGPNVAMLVQQIPELLNEMTRYLQSALPPGQLMEREGITYEQGDRPPLAKVELGV